MTERIDYAEEARRILSDVKPYRDQHLEVAMSSAQTHATLALVEQLRIANLHAIACGTSEGAMSHVAQDFAYMTLIENGQDGMLRPDIAAALGIKQEGESK